jgi:hypothetical protein
MDRYWTLTLMDEVIDMSRKARDGKGKPRKPIGRGDYLIGAQTGKLIADDNVRCATEKPS